MFKAEKSPARPYWLRRKHSTDNEIRALADNRLFDHDAQLIWLGDSVVKQGIAIESAGRLCETGADTIADANR
jgi:hypothetical protein